jgi:hypothetical protein
LSKISTIVETYADITIHWKAFANEEPAWKLTQKVALTKCVILKANLQQSPQMTS